MALTRVSYSLIEGAPINVLDRGVVNDGVTNNYLALKALSSTIQSNTQIYFPAGEYLVDARSFTLPPSSAENIGVFFLKNLTNISFIGEKYSKIKIYADFANGGALSFFQGLGTSDITISGFDIEYICSGTPQPNVAADALIGLFASTATNDADNITIEDNVLKIYHPSGANMGTNNALPNYGSVVGIYWYGENNYISNPKFLYNKFYDTTARVVWIWKTQHGLMQGNYFKNSGEYPCFRCLRGNKFLQILDNTFDMPIDGSFHSSVIFLNSQGVQSTGNLISGNVISVGYGVGIEIDNVIDTTISNNRILRPGTAIGTAVEGIVVNTSSTVTVTPANILVANNSTNRPILITGESNDVVVVNNVLTSAGINYANDPSSGGRQNHVIDNNKILVGFIRFYATSGSCSGNVITDSVGTSIQQTAANYVTSINISNNVIRNFNTGGTTGSAANNEHGIWITHGNCQVSNNVIDVNSVTANSYGIYAPSAGGNKSVITNNNLLDAATINAGANTIVYNNVVGNALVP